MRRIILVCVLLVLFSSTAFGFEIDERVFEFEEEWIDVSITLPQVEGENELLVEAINTVFRGYSILQAEVLRQYAKDTYMSSLEEEFSYFPSSGFSFISGYNVRHHNDKYLSITQYIYEFTGGAHGMTFLVSVNVDVEKQEFIHTIGDLDIREDYYQFILEEINRQIEADNPEVYWLPVTEFDITNFYLTPDGLGIFFQLYSIAPYSTGISEFIIPWELLVKE